MKTYDLIIIGSGLILLSAILLYSILSAPSTTGLCRIDIIAILAPETLSEPQPQEFSAQSHYDTALDSYQENGTWATLEDGTKCRVN